jgi:hypothetical protein
LHTVCIYKGVLSFLNNYKIVFYPLPLNLVFSTPGLAWGARGRLFESDHPDLVSEELEIWST